MNTDSDLRLRVAAMFLAVAGATVLPASEAVALRVQYCIQNSADTHGLYTNEVYYTAQCASNDRKCIAREHYFSFGDVARPAPTVDSSGKCTTGTTLVVDLPDDGGEGTAVLHGFVGANKNNMLVDVDVKFTGLHKCTAGDAKLWPKKFGQVPNSGTVSLEGNLYCARTIEDAEPDGFVRGVATADEDGGFGDFDREMDQSLDGAQAAVLQFGTGGNGIRNDRLGAYARFSVNVAAPAVDGEPVVISPKTWELGMTLTDPSNPPPPPPPPEPTVFDVVSCPNDEGDDTGQDPNNPDPTDARADCNICWYGKDAEGNCDQTFITEFHNEPGLWGRIALDGLYDVPDPRGHCHPNDQQPDDPSGAHAVPGGLSVTVDTVVTGLPGLTISNSVPGGPLSGSVYIPWYICGIPDKDAPYHPFVRLINADADFSADSDDRFRDVINSVVVHHADGGADSGGSQNPDVYCSDSTQAPSGDGTNSDPVVAWLPRSDEIPMVLPPGTTQSDRQIRDVTGGCGSARGGSSTRSYLLSNLVYHEQTSNSDFREIIGAEIDTIEATLRAATGAVKPDGVTADPCIVARQNILSNLFPDLYEVQGESQYMDHIRNNFNDGDYLNVLQKFERLLGWLGAIDGPGNLLDPAAELYSAFDTCYYRESDGKIVNLPNIPALDSACDLDLNGTKAEACYPLPSYGYVGYTPRNFRGDLQAQVEHVIWNIRENLLQKPSP